MDSGKVVLGVLAGFSAGALVGILFAPEKGSVTRKKILNKGEEYIDGVKEKVDELVEMVNQKIETAFQNGDATMKKAGLKLN